MSLAESAILLGLHTVRMVLLLLGRIIVAVLAFGTCQCYLCTHFIISSNFSNKKRDVLSLRSTNITYL